MTQIITNAVNPTTTTTATPNARLMGKQKFISFEELAKIPTPQPSGIWRPVSHVEAIETVRSEVHSQGWKVVNEQFGIVDDGNKLFSVMTLENTTNPEWRRCLGIRNSHDKSIRLGIAAGISVMVCSNLCFGGDKTVQRKHTTHIDVQDVVHQAVSTLDASFDILERRLESMKTMRISDDQARSILVQLASCGAIPSCDILTCFEEYKHPRHPDFEGESVWDLFNGVTEISHKYSPARVDRTHAALTRAFGLDGHEPGILIQTI